MVRHRLIDRARHTLGFTLLELLVVITLVFIVVAVVPMFATCRCHGGQSLKDKTQISMIHKSCLTFAADNKGVMPLPGLIRPRSADPSSPSSPQQPIGTSEDFAQNTTANLYSLLIAQNYFNPDIVIGTTEVNPLIVQKRDYNYNAYRPRDNIFWDSTFVADPSTSSNASYSHAALVGERKRQSWLVTQSAGFAAIGTRGTGGGPNGFGGALGGPQYQRSPTFELHGPKNQWDGHICFNDNHVETLNTFYAALCVYMPRRGSSAVKDNFFAAEFDDYTDLPGGGPQASNDSWLVMCTAVEPMFGNSCTPRWDQLNP